MVDRSGAAHKRTWPAHKVLRIMAFTLGFMDAVFLSVFALDAFAADIPLGKQLIGFAMHLIPSGMLVAIVVFAWWFPAAGGTALVVAATVTFALLSNLFWVNLMLALPVLATGCLYLASAWLRRRAREPH